MSNTPSLHDTVDPHETLSRDEAHSAHVHVTPFWPMFWVFAILLALTALTVWSSNVHGFWIGNTEIVLGGTVHILIAMSIAIIKALLVAMYFMHLKYDQPMNTVVAGATVFAVIMFIGLTLADSATRGIMDPMEHAKVVEGGTAHRAADGTWVTGKGQVEAARENAHAVSTNPGHTPAEKPAAGH
ncbi:MAG: cytochrome C oxidase subunit IV family protein [Phycisphaerae bacterium]|nr:cytochrome C oxidase subunit IV family protein [Phycisphaerae bacterium]